uniref:Uncharacterized protein n=1 Tax=Arundo donax TaxID=35708 RepID=A0A0A9ERS3_ARUDO
MTRTATIQHYFPNSPLSFLSTKYFHNLRQGGFTHLCTETYIAYAKKADAIRGCRILSIRQRPSKCELGCALETPSVHSFCCILMRKSISSGLLPTKILQQ